MLHLMVLGAVAVIFFIGLGAYVELHNAWTHPDRHLADENEARYQNQAMRH